MADVKKGPKCYQTRRMMFSASHRLHSPFLTDDKNLEIYGKCNHINGHGHNYVVKVTLFGELDEPTGMVMDQADLKRYMEDAIMKPMDHKNIDKDVEYFKSRPSTTENLVIFIWSRMKEIMHNPQWLYEVEVCSTQKNTFTYRGD